jgi:Glycosyltransferase family 92
LKYYLSICAMFKNESAYLREWIEFHRLMGVEHFFLYNNLSDDDYLSILEYYIDQGIVTVWNWPESWKKGTQSNVYRDCLDRYGKKSRWIAFIDLDEFLFAPNAETLTGVLKEYEGFPGIVVNWQVYGSSGHKKKPSGLVIENYIMKARTDWVRNKHVKSIVDPGKTIRSVGGHVFEYRSGGAAVTENFEAVRIITSSRLMRVLKRFLIGIVPRIPVDPYAVYRSPVKRVSVNKLRVNHYIVKSEEEALGAMKYHIQHRHFNQMHWLRYHDRNDESDTILCGYVPALKKRLSIQE